VQRGVANKSREIRVPVHIVEREQRIARAERQLAPRLGRVPTDAEVAEAARISVDEVRAAKVVARAALVLVYALAKGDKVDAVVRDATELGATRIVVTRTERSIV
jgi:DNA-directed RNA polymerase sigma subunit (sigma70/sigma32)